MAGLRKYAETEGVLDEVSHLFSGDEDQQIIAKLRKLEEETRALAAQKQAEVKDHIRGLSENIERQHRELAVPSDTSEIDALKADIAQAEAGIKRMEGENRELDGQLDEVRQAKAKLAETKARLAEIEATDVPRQRHAISLYANISNIRWDYQDEAKVKGYITSTQAGGDIRSFELDPTRQSENFIINYLWDKMAV